MNFISSGFCSNVQLADLFSLAILVLWQLSLSGCKSHLLLPSHFCVVSASKGFMVHFGEKKRTIDAMLYLWGLTCGIIVYYRMGFCKSLSSQNNVFSSIFLHHLDGVSCQIIILWLLIVATIISQNWLNLDKGNWYFVHVWGVVKITGLLKNMGFLLLV